MLVVEFAEEHKMRDYVISVFSMPRSFRGSGETFLDGMAHKEIAEEEGSALLPLRLAFSGEQLFKSNGSHGRRASK